MEDFDMLEDTLSTSIVNEDDLQDDVHPLDWDCPEKLQLLIEGALFATSERLTVKSIQALFPDSAKPSAIEINEALEFLEKEYEHRAVELHVSQQGYRFQVRRSATPLIRSMLTEKPPKYSRASLETLALIAYRQPITRGEIEEIRGVSVSSQIMKTMEEREWIRIVGHKELPGRPALWATTPEFLDYFGLSSLEDLPPLAEIQGIDKKENDNQTAIIVSKNVIMNLSEDQKSTEFSRNADLKAENADSEYKEKDQSDINRLLGLQQVERDVNDSEKPQLDDKQPLQNIFDRLRNAEKSKND